MAIVKRQFLAIIEHVHLRVLMRVATHFDVYACIGRDLEEIAVGFSAAAEVDQVAGKVRAISPDMNI